MLLMWEAILHFLPIDTCKQQVTQVTCSLSIVSMMQPLIGV